MKPGNLKHKLIFSLTVGIIATIIISSCTKDSAPPVFGDYPTEIGKIFAYRCATSGCHNESSANGAAGLSLATYASLFKGSVNGSPVIPYRSDFSSLCFFINTFDDLGPKTLPTMPINSNSLSRNEVETIKAWIDAGAPDINGNIMWSDNPDRKKFYVLNQGCDVVTVFDATTQLPMRYITVGKTDQPEIPHRVEVSHDGKYWYVIFTGSSILQKFRVSDDSFVSEVNLGPYQNWSSLTISNDNKRAYCVSWQFSSRLAVVDLENMALKNNVGGGNFTQGHGVALNKNNDTLYITNQYGNYIYKIDTALSGFNEIIIDTSSFTTTASGVIDPHEIMFSADGSKYFVTCQASHEVRVMSTHGDQLLQVINTGDFPQEIARSVTRNKLYISCSEGMSGNNTRGSVTVIDMGTLSSSTYPVGYQPHGIALDETNGYVIVASRNLATAGPAPHHSSVCGRNGFVSYFDINTMQLLNKKTEVAADPYSVSVRP
jgi:DNA-binding beta-propeller fold protein YncE